MPTTTDVSDVIKPVFEAVRAGQELWMETIRSWAESSQIWPASFSMTAGDEGASPSDIIDASFGCARKLLDAQEEYTRALWTRTESMWARPQTEGTKPPRPAKAGSEKPSA
jgi:hypothetical protein